MDTSTTRQNRSDAAKAARRSRAAADQGSTHAGLADNRPAAQRREQLGELANGGAVQRRPAAAGQLDESEIVQKKATSEPVAAQGAKAANRTGLPDTLKAGVEALSGVDLSPVRVHRNSAKPAQLQALAYAQGNDIHLGPGQEKHLPHEAWHVAQQKQGRVKATTQLKGATPVNDDPSLEKEADVMGAKALQTMPDPEAREPLASGEAPGAVAQARMGFEIEMLVLVDINGRPIPEKTNLGRAGAHNIELTVDHGPAVDAPTPTPARDANLSVPGMGPVGLGGLPGPLHLGAYDTPLGTETRMSGAAPDPRAALAMANLDWATWSAATAAIPRGRTRTPDNRAFVTIDNAIRPYKRLFDNWESAAADAQLVNIQAAIAVWTAANPNARTRWGRPASNARRTARYNAANAAIVALTAEVAAHRAMWALHPNPPGGYQRNYRQPAGGGGMTPWNAAHPHFDPREGMGRDRYASIMEIVTPGGPGYEPETAAGRANILGAINDAVALAAAIELATANFANRVRLNTVGTVNNVTNPNIHVGNPAQPAQTTDASIQSTMAIDLAHIASFFKSSVAAAMQPQQIYALKHHSDPHAAMGVPPPRRSVTEMARAAVVSQRVIRNHLAPALGGAWAGTGANLAHLRGVFTLICQYLMMGRHFVDAAGVGGLDKNIVPLLSRNDLGSVIYSDLVPPAEKALVAANLAQVVAAILAETGRNAATGVFNRAADNLAPGGAPPFNVSCTQFINNVLTGAPDGITGHLGGFHSFARPEGIDPTGARAGEYRHPGGGGRAAAAQREGAIFEMRNIVPDDALGLPTDRFPRAQWVPLVTHLMNTIAALNVRTTAQSARDTRYRQATGATHDELANW